MEVLSAIAGLTSAQAPDITHIIRVSSSPVRVGVRPSTDSQRAGGGSVETDERNEVMRLTWSIHHDPSGY